jgi:hypothetical protein
MNIVVTLLYFILIITWSFAYGCGKQQIDGNKKFRQITGNFDGHGDTEVDKFVETTQNTTKNHF